VGALQLQDAHALRRYAVMALHLDIRPWSVLRGWQSRRTRQSCWEVWDFDLSQTHREVLHSTRDEVAQPSSGCPVVIRTPIRPSRTSTRRALGLFSGRWVRVANLQAAGRTTVCGEVVRVPNRQVPGHGPYHGRACRAEGQCHCAGVNSARDRQTGDEDVGFHCGSVPLAISDARRSAIASFAVWPGLAAAPKPVDR
jgi:hypothetical protein